MTYEAGHLTKRKGHVRANPISGPWFSSATRRRCGRRAQERYLAEQVRVVRAARRTAHSCVRVSLRLLHARSVFVMVATRRGRNWIHPSFIRDSSSSVLMGASPTGWKGGSRRHYKLGRNYTATEYSPTTPRTETLDAPERKEVMSQDRYGDLMAGARRLRSCVRSKVPSPGRHSTTWSCHFAQEGKCMEAGGQLPPPREGQ
jgi:hypothetical protein